MKEFKCVAGCKTFIGGEIKHHKDCPYYPDSLSKMYDDLKSKVKNTDGNMKRAEYSTKLKLKHKLKSNGYNKKII